ncbi:glycosyltransferase [Terrabacter sp. Root85]|uniref:glycosyltransferase n=1 Tax=Terrabacter sp. Root85 TaxID=1736603 RepID=UPI00138EE679|nr:glycosyltransferase [Terrabacter sp. Root85]
MSDEKFPTQQVTGPPPRRPVYVAFANATLPDTDYRIAFINQSKTVEGLLVLPEGSSASDRVIRLDVRAGLSFATFLKLFQVPSVLKRTNAQWAHFFATQYSLFGPTLSLLTPARVLVTVTGLGRSFSSSRRLKSRILRWAYLRAFHLNAHIADVILFQNPADMQTLVDALPRHLHPKCQLIGSGVDTNFFPESRPARRRQSTKVDLLMVARLLPDKGVDDFLRLARGLSEEAVFTLVGPASRSHEDLLQKVLRADRDGHIRYLGEKTSSEVRTLYRDSDVVLFPSRSEGLPRVLLEAALSFKPIVAYDIPGCAAVLPTGHLVPRFDAEAFEERVVQLVRSRGLRERVGDEARHKVRLEFAADAYVKRLDAILASSVNASRSGQPMRSKFHSLMKGKQE